MPPIIITPTITPTSAEVDSDEKFAEDVAFDENDGERVGAIDTSSKKLFPILGV
jgi:hypothetical protein